MGAFLGFDDEFVLKYRYQPAEHPVCELNLRFTALFMENQPVLRVMKPSRRKVWLLTFLVGLAALFVAVFAFSYVRNQINRAPAAGSNTMFSKTSTLGLSAGAPQFAAMDMMAEESADYGRGIAPMPPQPGYGGQTAAEVDQKIIKNGSLQLAVDDVGESVNRITSLAGDKKGFVQTSSVSERRDGTHYGQITIRVPAAAFDAAMQEIKGLAAVVKNESASGQDVTEKYTDLEAQLRNALAQERTYLAVLDKAETVEEILKVQQYLGQIRGTIESLQGRLKYLENMTSYSTINVSLEEEPVVRVPTKEFRPLTSVKEAVQALVDLGQGLLVGLIWAVIVGGGLLLPFGLLALLVVLIVKKVRRPRS